MHLHSALLLLFVYSISAQSSEIKYYEDIIEQGIANASTYVYPTKNTRFEGYDTKHVKEFGTYDFIIVGAGSSGAVLANRLTENPNWTVLLLEAGGNETDFSVIPAMYGPNLRSSRNWGYRTIPQRYGCRGMNDHQCDFPRGYCLGGSSAINDMIWVRGNRRDYDGWVAMGNPGWSYDEVLPYFKKSETYEIPHGDPGYHGYHGPIHVEYTNPELNITKLIIAGEESLGFKVIDYNGRNQTGINRMAYSLKKGRRDSTNQGYIQPILRTRHNLRVLTAALATKILFDDDRKVTGVRFLYNKGTYIARQRKEVIVSSGSINTPQLLMLSGIGPKQQLDRLSIPVIADLPVGRNMEDHPCFYGLFISSNASAIDYPSLKVSIEQYLHGFGALTNSGIQAASYYETRNGTGDYPDIEVIYGVLDKVDTLPAALQFENFNASVMLDSFRNLRPNTLVWNVVLFHPKSRGSVTLKSTNPIDFPNIDPNYFSHPDDLVTMYKGIQILLRVLETPEMRSINATLTYTPIAECDDIRKDPLTLDADYWYCLILYKTSTIYHPVATARMGNDTRTSVVDTNLFVHGFHNLRVIDASVIPRSTSGHTNSPSIMIGERMSDVIKKHHS